MLTRRSLRHTLLTICCVLSALVAVCVVRPVVAKPIGAHQGQARPTPPRSLLGFSPGDDRKLADWRQITEYFSRLDKTSDRVTVHTLGETTLGRPLIVAFISAPENIRDLEKYKEIQRQLSDPRAIRDEAERDALIQNGKTVVAISCSMHSDEAVASQMSMQLAYELATAQDAATREILHNTILLLIPSGNPDGVDIVASWSRQAQDTPQEGTSPPALSHHYAGHDNNRDWFMLNLKETQLLSSLFWQDWFPQVIYDTHQQNAAAARFTVPPFYDPAILNILPSLNREIESVGLQIATDVKHGGVEDVATSAPCGGNRHGDLHTAAYYHNAIGILSETMSARLRAPLAGPDSRPQTPWRARDVMLTELSAARSLLASAAKNRALYLRNYYELGRANLSTPTYWPRAYLISAGQGVDEAAAKLIGALVGQGIEVYRLDRELHVTSNSALVHRMSARSMREAPAGSYIVFLSQPYGSLLRALFQPQTYSSRCVDNGLAKRAFDVVGGPLPMQMGVGVEAIHGILEPEGERRLTRITRQAEIHRDMGLPVKEGAVAFSNPIPRSVRLAVYQSATGATDEGWTRYILDTFNVPYKSLHERDFTSRNLREQYDVIILPSLRAAELAGGITDAGIESLHSFVRDGGVLICLSAAAEIIIDKFKLPLHNVLQHSKASRADRETAMLRINVEAGHPIASRAARDVDVSFNHGAAYELTGDGQVRSVARYAEKETFRSGLISDEDLIKGKTALAEISLSRGRIIVFGFSPQYRGQTWGALRLLFNSIMSAAK